MRRRSAAAAPVRAAIAASPSFATLKAASSDVFASAMRAPTRSRMFAWPSADAACAMRAAREISSQRPVPESTAHLEQYGARSERLAQRLVELQGVSQLD